MAIQSLPFTIEIANEAVALEDACDVRVAGYGHHLPQFRQSYASPEAIDHAADTTVLVAYDKATGGAVGTARIQTTTHGGKLPIESCIDLTPRVLDAGRAEITKLASVPGADPLVKLAIWKAGYLYCLANQARYLFMGARSRGLVRQYRRLGALPYHEDERMIPLSYAAGIPHQVLVFDVTSAERNWHTANHALFDFMFRTTHPDLFLFPRQNVTPREHVAPLRHAA